ncbi:hypothetical protein LIA77_01907 [Sarocladium implicatum]|nr:hypothetical protein LIA77_01907 [Sarocladium implicatum]
MTHETHIQTRVFDPTGYETNVFARQSESSLDDLLLASPDLRCLLCGIDRPTGLDIMVNLISSHTRLEYLVPSSRMMKRHWAPIYHESEKPLCGRPRKPRPLIERYAHRTR